MIFLGERDPRNAPEDQANDPGVLLTLIESKALFLQLAGSLEVAAILSDTPKAAETQGFEEGQFQLSAHGEGVIKAARGGFEVIKHLGVNRLKATVGPSMGGMTALAFEIMFPGISEGFVSMSSGPRSLPFSIALRSLQREIIRKDPGWMGGNYPRDAQPLVGMRLARKLGMITYRSAEEWRLRFGRERAASTDTSGDPFGQVFEVETYLEHHAQKFTGQFDANCYLYLSRASDLFDVAEHGSSVEAAMRKVEFERALIIGVKTDFLFPIYQQRELAENLEAPGREVQFVELDSLQGHDSFLVDMDNYRPLLATFFE